MKILFYFVTVMLGSFFVGQPELNSSSEASDKVVICHKGKLIEVSSNAVAGHLKHGDCLNSCDCDGGGGVITPY